jgi:hypothetical protein
MKPADVSGVKIVRTTSETCIEEWMNLRGAKNLGVTWWKMRMVICLQNHREVIFLCCCISDVSHVEMHMAQPLVPDPSP